ncbi:MAG: hypothetical protein KC589_04745 [Nanoarchaeota archaeon]|nr:hypothetical protein [Nanoarchaeota archaeon]
MTKKYYNLNELFEMIEEPNRSSCKKIYSDNKEIFESAKGSRLKHQAWKGGYLGHIVDIMNIAIQLYDNLNSCRKLNFSLSDSLLVLFLHDLEKPWKYAGNEKQKEELNSFPNYLDFIISKIEEYDFQFTTELWNGLKYVHGEGNDYNPNVNIQGPLAAFVHICDTISARIWFNFPNNSNFW